MRCSQFDWLAGMALAGALLVATPSATGLPVYHVVDLGALGGSYSQAAGISPSGLVVGDAVAADGISHLFIYDGEVHDIGALDGHDTYANAINDNRQIAGCVRIPGLAGAYPFHAVYYDGTTLHDIGTLGGSGSVASGINASGKVAGWSYMTVGSNQHDGFLYYGSTLHPFGGYWCDAVTVDDLGRVVGYNYTVVGAYYRPIAFMHDGTFHYLGTLGGTYSIAVAINPGGKMVGESYIASGATHAFLYDGTMHDLGTLGGTYSSATWINATGDICGVASLATGEQHGFLYTGATLLDLNSRLDASSRAWKITMATSMNDSGHIVGSGTEPISGQTHAVVLIPGPCQGQPYVAADLDKNCHVDSHDMELFRACQAQSAIAPVPACQDRDLDADNDVDQDDFAILQRCYNGSTKPPACTP